MRVMKATTLVCAIFALTLAGCGGSGGNSSPYVGHWVGSWAVPANSTSGTADITVNTDGSVTGSEVDSNNTSYTFAANISSTGVINGTVQVTGLNVHTFQGTLGLDFRGHLSGSVTQDAGTGNASVVTYDLARQ